MCGYAVCEKSDALSFIKYSCTPYSARNSATEIRNIYVKIHPLLIYPARTMTDIYQKGHTHGCAKFV